MQLSKETEKEELTEVETGLSCVQTVHGNYEDSLDKRYYKQRRHAKRKQC